MTYKILMSQTAYEQISYGIRSPEIVNVVIELSKKGSVIYEIDKETGIVFVDRILSSVMQVIL